MTFAGVLPHVNGLLNVVVVVLLLGAFVAVRSGRQALHARLMVSAVAAGIVFLAFYLLQWAILPHARFPGDDWLRWTFVSVLGTHELLALVAVPLVWRTIVLARAGRIDAHRRIVRFTYPVWAYVAVTGVVIYLLRHHVRPG